MIMTTFFELSERDPSLFVHNVGFGNAAGYLNSKGIEISQKELGSAVGPAVNPITGQRLDAEPEVELPEMTDEEKEREAERLFVLFERYVFLSRVQQIVSNGVLGSRLRASWTWRTQSRRQCNRGGSRNCPTTQAMMMIAMTTLRVKSHRQAQGTRGSKVHHLIKTNVDSSHRTATRHCVSRSCP